MKDREEPLLVPFMPAPCRVRGASASRMPTKSSCPSTLWGSSKDTNKEGENRLMSLFDHSEERQYIPLIRIKGCKRHHMKFHSAKSEGNSPRSSVLGQRLSHSVSLQLRSLLGT